MVFLHALMVKVRANHVPHNKPAHLTVGIATDGDTYVLGIRVPEAGNGPTGPRGIGESGPGMTRQDLNALIERLTTPHAAAVERRRHRRRGADRLPRTRRGVFPQKITDTNRILATVLHQRRFCTRQVLADLFNVSRGTIGNANAEVAPLLEQHGPIIEPAGSKFATATESLNSFTPAPIPRTPPNHRADSLWLRLTRRSLRPVPRKHRAAVAAEPKKFYPAPAPRVCQING